MSNPGVVAVRIVKGNKTIHIHGEQEGAEGVWLAEGQVEGLFDAPVKTTYKTGAFQEGSRQKARKWLHRDLSLGFHIRDTATVYELNESRFMQMFEYEQDPWDMNWVPTTIEVETTLSGVRKLDVFMYEAPDFNPEQDPQMKQYANVILKLRAGTPFWYQDDIVSTFSGPTIQATGFVTAENPCDIVSYQKFILTRATWELPDQQWVGAKGERVPGGPNAARTVADIIVSEINGGAVVDLDRQELMFRDANNTNILGQLSGRFFNYAIPPYTPPTTLPVAYESAPTGGAMVQLVIPQRWSRPWGLELRPDDIAVDFVPTLTAFRAPGGYSYGIPPDCDTIDIVGIGGGEGGGNGELLSTGLGGEHGVWAWITLVRGVDIPMDATTISGIIGAGGGESQPGGNTTAALDGDTILTAVGGQGGWAGHVQGGSAGNATVNDRTYSGGAIAQIGQRGNPPGGGGAGGWPLGNGGSGAPGQIWFYAYRTASGS